MLFWSNRSRFARPNRRRSFADTPRKYSVSPVAGTVKGPVSILVPEQETYQDGFEIDEPACDILRSGIVHPHKQAALVMLSVEKYLGLRTSRRDALSWAPISQKRTKYSARLRVLMPTDTAEKSVAISGAIRHGLAMNLQFTELTSKL